MWARTFASINIVIEIILFTVVGSTGTVWGPVVGPLLLIPAGELLRHELGSGLPGVHLLAYGVLLVVVIRSPRTACSVPWNARGRHGTSVANPRRLRRNDR